MEKRPKKADSGQVAIFVVLIFNVLFIFFAMVVNVGLLVHNKINLQNSVDLAAYYAAGKQAEMMGAAAHINYQIRQGYKLFAWRYRVLGTIRNFPQNSPTTLTDAEIPWDDPGRSDSFCVAAATPWADNPSGQNYCQRANQPAVPELRVPGVSFNTSFNVAIVNLSARLRQLAGQDCKYVGTRNWAMAVQMFLSYRQEMFNRKEALFAIANELSASTTSFRDIRGQSVNAGANETFQRNLTRPNREAADRHFAMYNGLAHPACAGGSETEPPRWLSEVKIVPTMRYLDTDCTGGAYGAVTKEIFDFPKYYADQEDTRATVEALAPLVAADSAQMGLHHSSLGVEKNPWCKAYVGVTARASAQLPFAPVDFPLQARSFAQPFGGRMGPWYERSWPRGSDRSNGGGLIDPLVVPRVTGGGQTDYSDPRRLANFSRFPGDTLGLRSQRSILGYHNQLRNTELRFHYWAESLRSLQQVQEHPSGDLIAWDTQANRSPTPSRIRQLELSAIMPDLFDITYYSIDPDFYHNYMDRMQWVMRDGRLRADLGARADNNDLRSFGVLGQIDLVRQESGLNFTSQYPYMVNRWQHLLTSWVTASLLDFSLDRSQFGQCSVMAVPEVPIPGSCVAGGRTGYSVKLISNQILSPTAELPLGGPGGGSGPILNPPPDPAQWQ